MRAARAVPLPSLLAPLIASRPLVGLLLALPAIAGIALTGCGGVPASIGTVDAGAPPDTLFQPGQIGSRCDRPLDPQCTGTPASAAQGSCATGDLCIPSACQGQSTPFVDGYCSAPCSAGNACPDGTVCMEVSQAGDDLCMQRCERDSDCRVGDGYACEDPTNTGTLLCYPSETTGGTNAGAACVPPPVTTPRSSFTMPNVAVPPALGDLFEAEGNVDVDGQGHAAVSYIASTATGSNQGVAAYRDPAIGGAGFAPTPAVFRSAFLPGFASDPVVAYDREASPPRLFLVYLDLEGAFGPATPISGNVLVTHSDAQGAPGSWSAPVRVSPAADSANAFLDKPWIVARAGTVVVTYAELGNGGGAHIRVARSLDDGVTFAAPIDADLAPTFHNLAQPVLDAAGDLFVSFYDGTATPQVTVASELFPSATFTRNVSASGTLAPSFDDPTIGVSDDGAALWITFADGDPSTGDDLYAAVSHDHGATFARPVKVNDDTSPFGTRPCATHFHGAVTVDGAGAAHVVWYDNRYLAGNVMYAHSLSDRAFSPNELVTDVPFPFTTGRRRQDWLGDYLGIASDGGHLYAAWTDPRTGSSHFRFAERALP